MSPRQPVINAKQLIKVLEAKGFYFSRQVGSHAIYKNAYGLRATIPVHGKKEIAPGTLRQILADTKITFDDLKAQQ